MALMISQHLIIISGGEVTASLKIIKINIELEPPINILETIESKIRLEGLTGVISKFIH